MELTPEQSQQRESRGPLEQALNVKITGNRCRCPYHNDQTPSAGIHRGQDGAWRFHCFVCDLRMDVFDVIARNSGRELSDVLQEYRRENKSAIRPAPEVKPTVYPTLEKAGSIFPNVEDIYKYTNPDTRDVEMAVIRYVPHGEKKRFAQASPVKDGWILKAPPGKLPIYNRTRVRDSEQVIVVEGERVVHALAAIGLIATTSPGGAGKPTKLTGPRSQESSFIYGRTMTNLIHKPEWLRVSST